MATTTTSITYYRGDSYPKGFTVTDSETGDPIDLTGYTLTLTVDSEQDPEDDTTQLFSLTGTLIDAVAGQVSFTPSSENNDLDAGEYYFDIQMTAGTTVRTIVKDKYTITQDINKA